MSSSNSIYMAYFKKYFPTGGEFPPALTIGLVVFLTAFYLIGNVFPSLPGALSLYPGALFKFDLNRLSLFPLCHNSFFHLLLNITTLLTPLSFFERKHGTVHTGVILNLLAMATAIPFCFVGYLFYPETHVVGASAWAFSFGAYYAHKESQIKPLYRISSNWSVPTLYTPFIALIFFAIFVPGSSFAGHLFGITAGYLLSTGYLNVLLPPAKVILFIESKAENLINLIPHQFIYYRETEAADSRNVAYRSLFGADIESGSAPVTTSSFNGQGHTLSN